MSLLCFQDGFASFQFFRKQWNIWQFQCSEYTVFKVWQYAKTHWVGPSVFPMHNLTFLWLTMFSSWLLPSIKFSWRDFNVFKSSSLIISSCWRSLIICNLRALCKRKLPLKALAIALPETMCWTAFSPYNTCMLSGNPDPFIEVPMFPRKLMRVWKPPTRQRMCKDFSVIISKALKVH